ncbi:MAG TPA: wax ester/triacylglycerol synthase family O-acyltransferase [Solirubrobacteraceae bacterium]
MPESLSPADRSSLNTERGPINMAVAGVMIAEAGPGLAYDAVCRRIEERLHLLPRYRQRLEQPPLGVAHPVWVDDEHFDVGWHVRSATLPAPGGIAELEAFVGREASRRMDRSRPLWELHLVDGLEGGRVAVIPKMHHALVDGLAALGAVMLLVDPTPEPAPIEPPAEPWTPRPYDPKRHAAQLATSPVRRALRWGDRLVDVRPMTAAGDLRRATDLLTELAIGRPAAPDLPFNREISPNRAWAYVPATLDALKMAGKRAGGSINDVVLAVVSGMLAGYLAQAGVTASRLPRDPVALVPVSVRDDADATDGNQISIVFVDLPVGEPDLDTRTAIIGRRMTAIKGSAKVRAGALMVGAGGFAPPLMASALARAAAVTPGGTAFNVVVSNVPGPQFPLYLNGSQVLGAVPVVPLNPADQGLNVGVLSYNGQVGFGVSADRALDPPVGLAKAALEAVLAQL